jgi:tetratricopeptide (TPR) repeat protein
VQKAANSPEARAMTVEAALEAVDKAEVLIEDRKDSDGLDLLLRAMPCLKTKWGKWDPRLSSAYILSGLAFDNLGDYPKALELFSLAMRVIGEKRTGNFAQAFR